jgi:hypothetical protein
MTLRPQTLKHRPQPMHLSGLIATRNSGFQSRPSLVEWRIAAVL